MAFEAPVHEVTIEDADYNLALYSQMRFSQLFRVEAGAPLVSRSLEIVESDAMAAEAVMPDEAVEAAETV